MLACRATPAHWATSGGGDDNRRRGLEAAAPNLRQVVVLVILILTTLAVARIMRAAMPDETGDYFVLLKVPISI